MNGGFSRPGATWFIAALLAGAGLAGCSVFNPPPPVVQPAAPAPVVPASDAAVAAPASAPAPPEEAAPDEADNNTLHTLQRIKRFIKRQIKPKPPAPPVVVAPTGPVPIITIQVLQHDQARGLLDAEVQRPDGKVIGRAVDLLVDAAGKPLEAVINLNGFMGVGDVKSNFPWSQLHFNPADRKAPVTLLSAAGESTAAKTVAGPTPLALLDTTVQDKNGAKVGRVVDVLLDKQAQPQAIVFDVSSSIGPDRHNIAAAWSTVRLLIKDKTLQVQMDLSDEQIKAAPPYASDQAARVIAPAAPAVAPHNPR